MFPLTARRYFGRQGPRSAQTLYPATTGTAGMAGSIVVLPVTTAATYVNLATLLKQTPTQANSSAFTDMVNGLQGVRIVLQAVTATVGILLGNLQGDVTGANAPVLATTGTLSSGAYTAVAGACWPILPGATIEFEAAIGQDMFLGFVGSTTGALALFQCSQPSPQ